MDLQAKGVSRVKQQDLVPFSEVVRTLHKLSEDKSTGVFHILSDSGEGASFVLNDGDIIETAFKTLRGNSALTHIRRIQTAKYFFDPTPSTDTATLLEDRSKRLPSNRVIFFRLGMGSEPEAASGDKGGAFKNQGNKVLVVEDGLVARKAIVRTLTEASYVAVEAANGAEALEKLTSERPNLVLLDLILPYVDGYEVLTKMKTIEEVKRIPVIILTSRDTLFDKLKGRMSGTEEYLTKPVEPGLLLEKVKKHIS